MWKGAELLGKELKSRKPKAMKMPGLKGFYSPKKSGYCWSHIPRKEVKTVV